MARCYSRNLKQKETSGKEVFESSDTDSDSDDDCGPVMKSGNNQENISCFSKDKLPPSFINEVVSIKSNIVVLRSNIQSLGECNKWISEFGCLTSTKWNTRTSNPSGSRFICTKKYVCHHSKFMKVPVQKNLRRASKNSDCLATIHIKVKLKTSATRRNDSFVKRGLLAIITIHDVHNHSLNSAEELKYLFKEECKELFFKYFNDGMGSAESYNFHKYKKSSKLRPRMAEVDLANVHITPTRRSVQHWYDMWCRRKLGQKTENASVEGAGPSKAPNDMDEDESKSGQQTSDSDVDVECCKPPDETTGNIVQNMSCFSEDKLPSSFINEVLTSNSSNNTIIIRSNVQNLEECNRWISEFGDLTNTKWNPRSSRPRGQKITCWKKYVCHRSKFNKVPADENKKGFSKNSGCLANICIRVKLKTSATRKKDSFIKKKGLLAIITIKDVHNHSFNTDLDFLYRSKEKFFKYFSGGMGVAESLKCHMKNGQLDHRGPAFVNRYRRRVRRWYDQWRVQNHDKKTEKIIEGDSSSKNEDDVNEGAGSSKITVDIGEGASTSKPVGIDGGSLNPNRPVLSLKCLHEDTDDESSSLKVAEDDPSSKFTDVKDVPELPLNDKDELKIDDIVDVEIDSEEHPNLEPVAKNLSTVILVPVYGNIAPQMPVMPLRTGYQVLHNFRIKFDCASVPKKADCPVFSESRNKLYVSKDTPFVVYVRADYVPEGSVIRCQAVFSRPEHACDAVTRCPTHVQQDYLKGYIAYEHFVQCINEGTIYEKNMANSKMSVSSPYVKPRAGETSTSYLFKLTCFNSCVGGINRRPFTLIFTLEKNKEILGRQAVEAKVCACPMRDCKIDDDRQEKRSYVNIQPKPATNSQPPGQSQSSLPIIQSVTHSKNETQSSEEQQEVETVVPQKNQTQSSGSEKQKYTITVHDRELFDFLHHMKVLYEYNVQPISPDM